MNKHWTFESKEQGAGEFTTFFGVTIFSLLINVGIATSIATFIQPWFGLTPPQWANVASVAGAAVALIVNFLGYKLLVFRT